MKDAFDEKMVVHAVCRELLAVYGVQIADAELEGFLAEGDFSEKIKMISDELGSQLKKWQAERNSRNDASSLPVLKNSEANFPDEETTVKIIPPDSGAENQELAEEKVEITIDSHHADEGFEMKNENEGKLDINNDEKISAIDTSQQTAVSAEEYAERKNEVVVKSAGDLSCKHKNAPHRQEEKMMLRFSNAMINTFYSERIAPKDKIIKIDGCEELGLHYDSATQCLSGTPCKAGEFKLSVTCLAVSGGSVKISLPFVVNYDPKSLWKDNPSDSSIKFWKKDTDAQEQEGQDGWRLVGASRRGRSHAHEGKCRDDDFALIGTHPQKWHILAVADGAGSSQYSREGSRIAAQLAANTLAAKLAEHNEAIVEAVSAWEQAGQSAETAMKVKQRLYVAFSAAVYAATNSIHQTSKKEQCAFRDFYTTLLIAAHREIDGKQFVVGYWIGDGGMAVYEEGGRTKLLGRADSGEYAGQTRFLDPEACTGDDISKRITFTLVDSITALLLLTDGITDPFFETERNIDSPEQWDTFWQEHIRGRLSAEPRQTSDSLLDWLSFWSPGNHDDRTIALLCKRNKLS